jgi:hypothetical protein
VWAGFAPTFDHIVPRASGGRDERDNLRLVHRACSQLRVDGNRLERLPPIPRSLKDAPLPPRVRINREGEAWCRNRDWKRCYPSLSEAWIASWRTFTQTGRAYTPYRCGRSTFSYAVIRCRISANPWCFSPFIQWIGSIRHRSRGCGFWHLTSRACHVLSVEDREALPKPMGWEAYYRATDGSWVRKDRECVRRDGLPKKCFPSIEEAQRCASSMSVAQGRRGRRYRAYTCSSAHIHIGSDKD